MANPYRGQTKFKAGEKDYTLSFSINSLCELEDLLGESVNTVAAQISNPAAVRMKTVRALIWAALQDNHPDVTLEQAGDITSEAGLPATMAAVGAAFAGAFPETAGEAKGGADRPQKAGGGSKSSRRTPAPALTQTRSGE